MERVRLLLDENLPPALVRALPDVFPQSAHVRDLGLQAAGDDAVWDQARIDGYVIATKDDDFRQRSFLYGFPPKVIWLRVGNCTRPDIAELLRNRATDIDHFAADPLIALLVLTRPR